MMQSVVKEWWHEFTQDKKSFYFTLALLVTAASFGGWKGYGLYVERREEAAQLAMSEALDEYYKALDAAVLNEQSQEIIEQILDDARIAFETFFSRNSGSYLVPYARALDADIAWYAGNKDRALDLIQQAINSTSVLRMRDMFRTKYALMLIDAGKIQEGLDLLRKMIQQYKSDDVKPNGHHYENHVVDYAAYYLGYYYWVQGDVVAAREAWKMLESFASENRPEGRSPWLDAAQAKLDLIS